MLNAIAPPSVQGVNIPMGQDLGFVDIGYGYPFDVTIPSANELLTNQALALLSNADPHRHPGHLRVRWKCD